MQVVARRVAELRSGDRQAETPANPSGVKLEAAFNEEQAVTFAVDLAFGNPFAPYELHYSEEEFMESLRRSATELHLGRDLVERVLVLKGEAMGAHSRIFASRWKLALAGVSSAVAIPFIPAFVGAAAGVAGVELVRGGSLAMGGLRLATGGWLVAGVKSAASSSAKAGARRLVNVAPAGAVRVEVAKWQTRVALLVENGCWSKDDVAGQLERLEEVHKEVEEDLAAERKLNDPGANRIRDLEDKVRAIAAGRDWLTRRMQPLGGTIGARPAHESS
jgi:hypothetical protein